MFVMTAKDVDDGLALRLSVREAHLAYVRSLEPGFIKMAGPFLDPNGEMCGSLFIFEAPDMAAIEAYLAKDPYVTSGLFTQIDIRPFRVTIPWS
jgi:uncharacterized protein YciI